ncbi:MFS transporter [Gramella sp. BOM4]|nr:MFS transporter [Christiangramia bathymodioli]
MKETRRILPVIVIAQFCCTSLWFAGNGVMTDLLVQFKLAPEALGHLTSAVQFGFISGTLLFAFLTISDRFSPSRVFFVCALAGAVFNLGILLENNTLFSLIAIRFFTGFSLAGIYPVGMKIASDYFHKGLGRSLGYLVGALVVGTALPHLLKEISGSIELDWRSVIFITSTLATAGGFMILLFVPDGPFRTAKQKPDFSLIFKIFKNKEFRAAAFGYFGHMWELYSFWAFVPVLLAFFSFNNPEEQFSISFLSFCIIGLGGIACVLGGYLSERFGTKKTAGFALFCSGLCCLISPMILSGNSLTLLTVFLIFWGLVVVADSPLFSTLVASNTEASSRGTALTIVNCIGFSITILSIQLINFLSDRIQPSYLLVFLAIGPVLGLTGLFRKNARK